MRMCQEYIIDHRFIHRELHIVKYVFPLLHTIIHKDILPRYFQIVTTSRNLMIRTNEFKSHSMPS